MGDKQYVIAVGSDDAGVNLKNFIRDQLREDPQVDEVVDFGVAHDPYSIERSILSNNCQVLCLGERVIAPELADRIVKQWLGYEFDASSPGCPEGGWVRASTARS